MKTSVASQPKAVLRVLHGSPAGDNNYQMWLNQTNNQIFAQNKLHVKDLPSRLLEDPGLHYAKAKPDQKALRQCELEVFAEFQQRENEQQAKLQREKGADEAKTTADSQSPEQREKFKQNLLGERELIKQEALKRWRSSGMHALAGQLLEAYWDEKIYGNLTPDRRQELMDLIVKAPVYKAEDHEGVWKWYSATLGAEAQDIISQVKHGDVFEAHRRVVNVYERNTVSAERRLWKEFNAPPVLPKGEKFGVVTLVADLEAKQKTLERMGMTITPRQFVFAVLNSLSTDLDNAVKRVEERMEDDKNFSKEACLRMVLDAAESIETNEDQAKGSKKGAFVASAANGNQQCRKFNRGNCPHGKGCRYEHNKEQRKQWRANITCRSCGEKGHYQSNCPSGGDDGVSDDSDSGNAKRKNQKSTSATSARIIKASKQPDAFELAQGEPKTEALVWSM